MKALIAEDDPVARRVLAALLTAWGYDVVAVADGVAAWTVLSAPDAPKLALVDWEMPGIDGVEVCRRIRKLGSEPYTYVLLLTGRAASRDLVDGLDGGADDYVTKPFDAAELEARLRVGRRIVGLQQELFRTREAMRHQALHDGLTGLLNRSGIVDALSVEYAEMARRGGDIAVVMADLDRFKRVNDEWGHSAGDEVLREAAARMRDAVRPYDHVGRMGGEEFLLVLPGADRLGGLAVAERVRERIAADPFLTGGGLLDVTCSLGVASTDDPTLGHELVRTADYALYRAKNDGRNRVVLWDSRYLGASSRVA